MTAPQRQCIVTCTYEQLLLIERLVGFGVADFVPADRNEEYAVEDVQHILANVRRHHSAVAAAASAPKEVVKRLPRLRKVT